MDYERLLTLLNAEEKLRLQPNLSAINRLVQQELAEMNKAVVEASTKKEPRK